MSTNGLIPSFRLPVNVRGLVHDNVAEAIENHDDQLTDLSQAIPALKSQIDSLTTSTATGSTTENVTTSSETIITEPSTIGMVNDQTGQTAYTTQQSDYGAFILLSDASPIAVTLAVGPTIQLPWYAVLLNEGAGLATLTPPSGSTISYPGNAGAASMPLPQNVAAVLIYDGTNFEAILIPISPQNTPEITSQWLNSFNSTTGVFGQSQPAIADVSGLATALALLAPLASPTLTGTPTAPTASPGTDDTQIATTAYADAAVTVETIRAEAAEALLAPLASPTLAGTPTAPTAAIGTNTTQIATTAFVQATIAAGITTTITTAALTPTGTQGSMAYTAGILTSSTPAT